MYFAKGGTGLALFGTDLRHFFGSNIGNVFRVMLRGKRPHEPKFANDIVRIHSFLIDKDLIEYNIVGDTKAAMHRCFLFISMLKAGNIKTTRQYMN